MRLSMSAPLQMMMEEAVVIIRARGGIRGSVGMKDGVLMPLTSMSVLGVVVVVFMMMTRGVAFGMRPTHRRRHGK